MGRAPRSAPGGYVYHALNRAVAGLPLFEQPTDYEAFEKKRAGSHRSAHRGPSRLNSSGTIESISIGTGRIPAYQRALDHSQCSVSVASPRRTGLACRYSIIDRRVAVRVMLPS